jgi:hypothetical protein
MSSVEEDIARRVHEEAEHCEWHSARERELQTELDEARALLAKVRGIVDREPAISVAGAMRDLRKLREVRALLGIES